MAALPDLVRHRGFHAFAIRAAGKRELPLLSVLVIKGGNGRTARDVFEGTRKLAYYRDVEWRDPDIRSGLAFYPEMCAFLLEKYAVDLSWNLEYFLGNYAPLKGYAARVFERWGHTELAGLYHTVYECAMRVFRTKTSENCDGASVRAKDHAGSDTGKRRPDV